MGTYRICVYAICKNESQFVDRWMNSMGEADLVVVTDTGSTDDTVEKLRSRGAVVYEESINPWRFDEARNRSLAHVPEDVDICVCTDLDECFRPGWRALLDAAWTPDTTTGHYLYNWSLKEDGTPLTQFTYFKIHGRSGHTWACPVHEYLSYIGKAPERTVFIEGLILDHFPDESKSRSAYLPLLELAVKEAPDSDRMAYYLGREYLYAGRWQDCIDSLKRHLALPSARWPEERGASMRWIARAYLQLGNQKESYRWYCRAIGEVPHMRDPYVEFAQAAYQWGDWPTVLAMTAQALCICERSGVYVNMGYAWDHTPHDLAAIACYHLGLPQASLFHTEEALALNPEDQRLEQNRLLLQQALARHASLSQTKREAGDKEIFD